MLSNTFLKSIRDLRRSIIWWSLGFFVYAIAIALFYPSISDAPELRDLLGDEDSILSAFAGGVEDITSPEGFLTAEALGFSFPLMAIAFALWLGSSWLVGEERRGVLEILLSHPVRRSTELLQKYAAILVGLAFLCVVVFIGTLIGIIIVDMELSLLNVASAYVSLGLLGAFFGALALFAGALTGRVGASIGVGGAAGIASYVANSFAPIVNGLEWAQYLSPFYYYLGNHPLSNGLNLAHAGALVAGSAILVGLAAHFFERRDLGV